MNIDLILQFLSEHQQVLVTAAGMLFVSVIDFIYAINPSTNHSGWLHQIYAFFGGKK